MEKNETEFRKKALIYKHMYQRVLITTTWKNF